MASHGKPPQPKSASSKANGDTKQGNDQEPSNKPKYTSKIEQITVNYHPLKVNYDVNVPPEYRLVLYGFSKFTSYLRDQARKQQIPIWAATNKKEQFGASNARYHVARVGFFFPEDLIIRACRLFSVEIKEGKVWVSVNGNLKLPKDTLTESVDELFPHIPPENRTSILRDLDPRSGRGVAKAKQYTRYEKIELAVGAYIRHHFTDYERLLRGNASGNARNDSRKHIQSDQIFTMLQWKGENENEVDKFKTFDTEVFDLTQLDDEDDEYPDFDDDARSSTPSSNNSGLEGSGSFITPSNYWLCFADADVEIEHPEVTQLRPLSDRMFARAEADPRGRVRSSSPRARNRARFPGRGHDRAPDAQYDRSRQLYHHDRSQPARNSYHEPHRDHSYSPEHLHRDFHNRGRSRSPHARRHSEHYYRDRSPPRVRTHQQHRDHYLDSRDVGAPENYRSQPASDAHVTYRLLPPGTQASPTVPLSHKWPQTQLTGIVARPGDDTWEVAPAMYSANSLRQQGPSTQPQLNYSDNGPQVLGPPHHGGTMDSAQRARPAIRWESNDMTATSNLQLRPLANTPYDPAPVSFTHPETGVQLRRLDDQYSNYPPPPHQHGSQYPASSGYHHRPLHLPAHPPQHPRVQLRPLSSSDVPQPSHETDYPNHEQRY